VVVDIGTGPGILALLACQAGARRVYAIDVSDAIQVGRELAAANSYADRIEFIQALSTQVTLPESADVIVSDLHGAIPLFQLLILSLVEARRRFLAPGGVMIPQQETLWAAVLEFDVLSRVLANVAVRRVTPGADLASLPRLCETILEDFEALAPAGRPRDDNPPDQYGS
jgi:predicted RNA methylase